MKISAIVLSSGESERFGENKMLYSLAGEPIILKTVKAFDLSPSIDEIVVCIPSGSEESYREILKSVKTPLTFTTGGKNRHLSTIEGLLKANGDMVLIHDGARCFVAVELIERIVSALSEDTGVIPVIASTDSLVSVGDNLKYLERKNIKCVQTPQAFDRVKLLEIYKDCIASGKDLSNLTDNGSVWQTRYPLIYVDGDINNKKITYKSDCLLYTFSKKEVCEDLNNQGNSDIYLNDKLSNSGIRNSLKNLNSISLTDISTEKKEGITLKIGNGYDMHELVENRKLILGGVTMPHNKGLLGVSDADVVLHALMDALLSSLSLPDIGHQFPPTDPQYQGADSTVLLKTVLELLAERNAKPQSVSITILAQKPKLFPYIPLIKDSISTLLGVSIDNVGISATTTEGLGLIGREEGIACYATCIVKI